MVAKLRRTTDGQVIRCGYCPRKVVFHTTVFGGPALCFDATPMAAVADVRKHGWMAGTFVVDGMPRLVFAPWMRHTFAARRRNAFVHQLHECSGQTRAVVA